MNIHEGSLSKIEMKLFFHPASLVIYGLSNSPGNLGKNIVQNLKRFGFTGRVYGVGRTEMTVDGITVYNDLGAVPEKPDLVVLIIPARAILDALRSCRDNGIKQVIIEAAGFSEKDEQGRELELEIRALCSEAGIACMGPNCVGVINKENGLCTPFIPFEENEISKGPNSFITQSGGTVHDMLHRCATENVGLNKIASIGNKLLLSETDVLQFLIDDPETRTIGLYCEDIRDGRRLMQQAVSTPKPIVMIKGNMTPLSRQIARFHTGALIGDGDVTQSAFRQAGIHYSDTIQGVVDSFKIFSLPLLKGPRLAIIARSGGQGVLLADKSFTYGFSLATLPDSFFDPIRRQAKAGVVNPTNPIDMGDIWNVLFYLEVVEMALKTDAVDGVVFHFENGNDHDVTFTILQSVEKLCRTYDKPVVMCMVPDPSILFELRNATPFPFFTENDKAFKALRRSLDHYNRVSGLEPKKRIPDLTPLSETTGSPQLLPVQDAMALLEDYGIPMPAHAVVTDSDQGQYAAEKMGYPVAVKQAEPPLLHKTESGAVRLDIRDNLELETVINAMPADTWLIQAMCARGVETIIGGKRDSEFGPVVLFGLGGVYVEVLKDVTMRVAPIDKTTALEMINEIKGAPILYSTRGTPESDIEALAEAIVQVSELLSDHPEIDALDINPYRVFKKGHGGAALDVKIQTTGVLDTQSGQNRNE